MAAGIQETMSSFLSETWNVIDTDILSRIPGWVLISLAVNLTSDSIQMIINPFSSE
jgi:small neutral amino acid transporter SnatA (MarC family)